MNPLELFAAEIQYWRLEPDAWRPVLEQACAAGLPGISGYVPWEVHEIEPGVFDFEGRTDPRRNWVRFLELVKELGLKLAYRPGPFVCNEMDWGGHPRRLVVDHAATCVLQADGTPAAGYRLASKEGDQPSYLHPAYLEEVRRWFEAADSVARGFDAARGGPIHLCQLDNELSYICRDDVFGSDYNPCVVERGGWYHRFLAEKYGSPDALPYAGRFGAFEDVEPPRALGADVERDLARYFDWIECKEWMLERYLRELRAMHEANGLDGVRYYTNLNPHRPEGVPTSFRRFAAATDGLVGYDFYRKPWLGRSAYASMARVLRVMGAVLDPVWSAEFMCGWWFTDMGNSRVPPDHMRFMTQAALANGCKAVSWFMFHDRPMWGDAPVSDRGRPRDGLAALRDVVDQARAVEAWGALRPADDFAVLTCRPYLWHAHLGDPSPCSDNALHVGEPLLWGAEAGAVPAEIEGLFRTAQLAGYSAGCVDLTDAPDRLGCVRAAWMPTAPFLAEDTARRLEAFVEAGGVLVLTGPWPARDLRGAPLTFLGRTAPPEPADGERFAAWTAGRGRVAWSGTFTVRSEPGEEDLDVVAETGALLGRLAGPPAVRADTGTVRWKSWKKGGGTGWHEEPRRCVDAILHRGGGAEVLFLVNLHERSVDADVVFGDGRDARLAEVGGYGETLDVRGGCCRVVLDRKSARVFRVAGAG